MEQQAELQPLIEATARENSEAFARLYQLSSPRLYGLAISMVKQPAIAEDILQEAFIRVWYRAKDYYVERGSVMAWLASIVRYRALDWLRANNKPLIDIDSVPLSSESAQPGPLASIEQDKENYRLQQCMEQLEPQQQNAIAQAFITGTTHRELAALIEVPLGTLKSWIRRGLASLRRCLEQ